MLRVISTQKHLIPIICYHVLNSPFLLIYYLGQFFYLTRFYLLISLKGFYPPIKGGHLCQFLTTSNSKSVKTIQQLSTYINSLIGIEVSLGFGHLSQVSQRELQVKNAKISSFKHGNNAYQLKVKTWLILWWTSYRLSRPKIDTQSIKK